MSELKKTSEFIVEQMLPDVRKGRMLILVDDEDRENEGDLFVAAERATPEAINFMATRARGLVSLALTESRMRDLGLALITDDHGNSTRFGTAFATPIDAREGVASGMSARDRARTIAVAIADGTRPGDLVRPGRLQVQERLTVEIRNCIQDTLKPLGVAVVIEAQHLCMVMRGIQKQHSIATTSAFAGEFEQERTRGEFLRLIS